MRRKHALVGGGVAVLATAIVALGSAGASSGGPSARWGSAFTGAGAGASAADDAAAPDLRGGHLIQLFEQATNDSSIVDVGPSGFSPGDYVVFHDNLLTADQSQQVGDLYVQCMFLFRNALCHGTAHLSGRGDISFEGLSPAGNRPSLIAVTGGTKEFQTASGEIRVVPVAGTQNAQVTVKLTT